MLLYRSPELLQGSPPQCAVPDALQAIVAADNERMVQEREAIQEKLKRRRLKVFLPRPEEALEVTKEEEASRLSSPIQ